MKFELTKHAKKVFGRTGNSRRMAGADIDHAGIGPA